MEIKVKSYKSQSSLISSILYFIIGGILLTKAEEVLSILSLVIGIFLAIGAIIAFTIFYISNKKEEEPKRKNLIYGIILLIFAIIFIFFSNIVAEFIRFIVGGWILFTGIIRLINALSMNNKNTKFIPLLIVSILLIAVGIYTIVKGDILLGTVGLIMMIYAAIEILGYVFYSKDTLEKEETGATTLIVPEESKSETKENTKIKDVKEKKKRKKSEK